MTSMSFENDELRHIAEGWLAYQRAAQVDAQGTVSLPAGDDLFEFVEQVDDLVRKQPEVAWLVIQLIFMASRDDLERANLAAGPLEDLLAKHGDAFIGRVEQAASNDAGFRELLVGVWRNGIAPPVWERVQRAAGTE